MRGGGASLLAAGALAAIAGGGVAVGQPAETGAVALLKQGSDGPGVAPVQRALGLPATGEFDARTTRAVRAFQRRKGLQVDGIVGPQTRAALGIEGPAVPQQQAAAASPALERIAQCESGGNPSAVGGGGLYRGKYQFSYETWRSVGGSGDPAAAPEAEQDRRAAMLVQRSGTGHWPNCG
jgi:peptidoglycan hydrolase-like protein with peptidoglycan-binding domain